MLLFLLLDFSPALTLSIYILPRIPKAYAKANITRIQHNHPLNSMLFFTSLETVIIEDHLLFCT